MFIKVSASNYESGHEAFTVKVASATSTQEISFDFNAKSIEVKEDVLECFTGDSLTFYLKFDEKEANLMTLHISTILQQKEIILSHDNDKFVIKFKFSPLLEVQSVLDAPIAFLESHPISTLQFYLQLRDILHSYQANPTVQKLLNALADLAGYLNAKVLHFTPEQKLDVLDIIDTHLCAWTAAADKRLSIYQGSLVRLLHAIRLRVTQHDITLSSIRRDIVAIYEKLRPVTILESWQDNLSATYRNTKEWSQRDWKAFEQGFKPEELRARINSLAEQVQTIPLADIPQRAQPYVRHAVDVTTPYVTSVAAKARSYLPQSAETALEHGYHVLLKSIPPVAFKMFEDAKEYCSNDNYYHVAATAH